MRKLNIKGRKKEAPIAKASRPTWGSTFRDYFTFAEANLRRHARSNIAVRTACLEMYYPPVLQVEEMMALKPKRFTPGQRKAIRAIIKRMSKGIPDEHWRILDE